MGLSMGGTNTSSTANATQTPTFSAAQTSLQGLLSGALSSLLPQVSSGGISPNVQATETQSANQINQNYSSMGDRMNKFLAARGFGQSGSTGKAALQTELGRQGALAGNASSAAGQQLNLDSTYLSDALMAAYAVPGSVNTGNTSGNSSGWGVSASGSSGGMFGNTPWAVGA